MRSGVLVFVLAVLAVGIGVLMKQYGQEPAKPSSVAAPTLVANVHATAQPAAAVALLHVPAVGAPVDATWSAMDTPARAAQHYLAAKNKKQFVDKALETGGGAYVHFAEIALRDCTLFSFGDPVSLEQRFLSHVSIQTPNYAGRVAAYRSAMAACAGFGEGVAFQMHRTLHEKKGRFSDPLSQAAQLVRGTADRVAPDAAIAPARVSAIRTLLDAGDPYVVHELSVIARRRINHVACAEGKCRVTDDAQIESMAWRLAAEELGVQSDVAQAAAIICAHTNVCGKKSYAELARAETLGMSGKLVEASFSRSREITDAVRRKDWDALGF